MFKKITAFFVAAICMCSSAYARIVTEKIRVPADWSFVYEGNATADNCSYSIDTENARSESNALSVSCRLANSSAGSMYAAYNLPSTLEKGSYELTFYVKGTYTVGGIYAGVEQSFGVNQMLARFTKSDDADGWKKYTKTITYNGEGSLRFKFGYGCSAAYIDDISMTKSGTNAIANGGFERMSEISKFKLETDAPAANPSRSGLTVEENAYMPQNVVAYKANGKAALSWVNPTASIAKAELYEVIGGTDSLISDELNTASAAGVKYFAAADGEQGLFKLIFTFSDGKVTEYAVSAADEAMPEIPGWDITCSAGTDDAGNRIFPMAAYLDSTVKHGAKAAFKMLSNGEKSKDGSMTLSQEVKLSTDNTYIMYLWSKADGDAAYTVTYGGNTLTGTSQNGDDGWKCYTYYIDLAEMQDKTLSVTFEKNVKSLWLDDIELYCLKDGIPTGSNLLENGDFEEDASAEAVSAVSELKAEAQVGAVKLDWKAPQSKCKAVYIYRKTSTGYVKCAQTDSSVTSVTFTNLENGKEYEFAVVAVGDMLNDSEALTAEVTTLVPEYDISDITRSEDNGIVTFSRKVTNSRAEQDIDAELIAVLSENGVITKIASAGAVKASKGDDPKTISAAIDVSGVDKNNSYITVYTWSGLFDLKILMPCETYSLK